MKDQSKTKQALIQELAALRLSIAELEQSESKSKQVGESLGEGELWLKSIFNALQESVLVVTCDRRLLSINPATQKIFGYSQKELFNQSTEILHVDHEHYLEFGRRIQNAFAKEETASFEFEARRKDGEIFPTEHTVSLLKSENGEPKGIVSVVRDVTDRKRAEAQLHASLREKEILLREIHHRVKNNLQVISGLLDLQARSSGNPVLSELLTESQSRIRSIALIHGKLYDSKNFSSIDLCGYVKTLSQDLCQSHKINPEKIALIFQTDGDVYVDINKAIPCGLILNELISNALKHAFPGDEPGEIKIIIGETKNTEIEIVVRDNGMGLPDDIDIHQPQTVGLYLVNGLIKNQLEGQLEVRRDNGIEYRIRFPF
jgi:PAS domain S-box-containing protein